MDAFGLQSHFDSPVSRESASLRRPSLLDLSDPAGPEGPCTHNGFHPSGFPSGLPLLLSNPPRPAEVPSTPRNAALVRVEHLPQSLNRPGQTDKRERKEEDRAIVVSVLLRLRLSYFDMPLLGSQGPE
ncbi:unnamed protein product [Boreogadus saida]